VSHDTEDAKYSTILGNVVQRQVKALSLKSLDKTTTVSTAHPQCKWTGCGQSEKYPTRTSSTRLIRALLACPPGYHAMSRVDKNAKNPLELMLDDTGCDGDGSHTLCCLEHTSWHYCGWHTHNNGRTE
jgi:chitinase